MLIRNYTNQTEMIIISLKCILFTPFQISNMPKDILSRVANLWQVLFEFQNNHASNALDMVTGTSRRRPEQVIGTINILTSILP